jgi:hypothetical protein
MANRPTHIYMVHSVDNSQKAVNEAMATFALQGWELVSGSSDAWAETDYNNNRIWNTTYVMYWRQRYDPQEQPAASV